ncbi:MAG: AlpA family phage regulatory protein [Moraxellaceae bacterium]|nr:AlpA family phage regulatory protein [Moraxellaceae bacterium]
MSEKTENSKKLIRSKQLCEKLCISTTTLFTNFMKDDTFPKATKIGGTNAWFEHEIDTWLDQQREKQRAEVA